MMLISEKRTIGTKLYSIRKKKGLTQAETAEKIGMSNRAYADIERGTSSMKLDTFLRICSALNITPNELLVLDDNYEITKKRELLIEQLLKLSGKELETAVNILTAYLSSLDI